MFQRKLSLALLFLFLLLSGCAQIMGKDTLSVEGAPEVARKPQNNGTSGAEAFMSGGMSIQPGSKDLLEQMSAQGQRFNERLQSILEDASNRGVKVSTRPGQKAPSGEMQEMSIDFFEANVIDVIQLFMEVLEQDYILHAGVGGSLTLHIKDEFHRDQLIDLLRGVLRIQGVAMLQNAFGVWEFMPLSEAPKNLAADKIVLPEEGFAPVRGQAIQGFRLRFAAASEMVNILQPHLSTGSMVYANDPQGLLLICDYPHALAKAEKLINLFDVSVFADLKIKVFPLKYVLATDLQNELQKVSEASGLAATKGREAVSFLALERLNMLCVLAKDKQSLDFVEAWIRELDRELPQIVKEEQEESIFVYYVQNGDATEIVATLKGIFEGSSPQEKDKTGEEGAPLGKQLREITNAEGNIRVENAAPTPPQMPHEFPGQGINAISGKLSGEVSFVVDETTNSILTRCRGTDYKKIESVIDKLDIYPKQVLIEVIIAEVKLDDSTKLGVEWKYILNLAGDATGAVSVDSGLGTVTSGSTNISSGLAFTIGDSRLAAAIRAFADDNRVQILSSPHILASNHKEAVINIGEEVPIVTSELRTTEASSTATTVDKTIQYRDTGIILSVTPHINERGLVRLELNQEVSEMSTKTVEGITSPLFSNRVATSTVAVNDGQTVVIGGLIKQSQNNASSGLPGINKLPLLKYLFGYEERSYSSTELLLFITPHVVESRQDNELFSRNFLNRLEEIKATMR